VSFSKKFLFDLTLLSGIADFCAFSGGVACWMEAIKGSMVLIKA
jgi:hypothetical protein